MRQDLIGDISKALLEAEAESYTVKCPQFL